MTRNKFILAGLLAGAMAFAGCKSNDAAEKGGMSTEPTQTQPQTPTTPQDTTTPPGTGGSEQLDDPSLNLPPSDMGEDTGGSGYQDPMLFPEGDQNATQPKPDVRDQDPVQDPGIGGSGYEGDDSMLQEEDQRLGGDKFPGDHNVPQ